MSESEPHEDLSQPVTDRAKADALNWAREPRNSQGKRTFAHINGMAAWGIAVFLETMDFVERLLDAEIDPEEMVEALKNPRIYKMNDKIESPEIHNMVENLLDLSVAVGGKRAEEILKVIKDMARPEHSFLGQIGNLLGDKEETEVEEDYPEEID